MTHATNIPSNIPSANHVKTWVDGTSTDTFDITPDTFDINPDIVPGIIPDNVSDITSSIAPDITSNTVSTITPDIKSPIVSDIASDTTSNMTLVTTSATPATPVKGRLYGLGIGPGDPELLTLKAHRILCSVPVVAYPTMENGKVLARAIVADYLRPEQIELPMPLPFSPTRSSQPAYDLAAEAIARHLSAGRDVAVLCEGEPFLYGSFMYIFNRLSNQFHTEVVPGISSTMASAAALGVPLTYRNDVLSIMPATLDAEVLRDRLSVADAAVIIKLGRHFAKVREVLIELGLFSRALYIERATMPNQRIVAIADIDPAEVPYWALIMIPSLQKSVT